MSKAAEEFEAYLAKKKELLEKHPILFPEGKQPYCGLDCGTGWFPLIDRLCTDLEKIITESGLPIEESRFGVAQIKEKFGLLRFYTDSVHEKIFEAVENRISLAEKESGDTCESCGEPGSMDQNYGWLKTYCEKCKNKRE